MSYIFATNVVQNEIYSLTNFFRNIPASQILFNVELIQRLLDLTASLMSPIEVRTQAITCLALYCKFHEGTALYLINQQGVIELFWSMVVENDTTGILDRISWFFAVIAAVQIPKIIVSVHFTQIVIIFL